MKANINPNKRTNHNMFSFSIDPAKIDINLKKTKLNVLNQEVRNKPERILVGSYLTKKGLKLKANGELGLLHLYTKNRYIDNPDSFVIKTIKH